MAPSGSGIQLLQQLPVDVEHIRQLLFSMPVPFSMRAEVFDRHWPLIDNVWCKQYQGICASNIDGGPKVEFDSIRFPCRFARNTYDGTRNPDAGPPVAKRKRREGGTCSCRVKAKCFRGLPGIPDHYLFDHSSQKESDWVHSHTLDESDAYKVNSFLKTAAAEEVAKGLMPAEVYKAMREVPLGENESALEAAGGKFMTRQHVGNAKQSSLRESTNSALAAAGGRFMTRQHVVDAKDQWNKGSNMNGTPKALYASPYTNGGTANRTVADSVEVHETAPAVQQPYSVPVSSRASDPLPNKTWPVLGHQSNNHREHKSHIRIETRQLIESTTPGTHIPREVLLPLLNSILVYMDKEDNVIDGNAILVAIQSVQETATATRENTEHLMSRYGFYGPPSSSV